jgi:DNA polymerase elongation subunit (family B)
MSKNPSKMSAAQMFGKPAVFHQYFLNWGNGKQTYIIDLYLGVLAWDFVARKLTSWSLKTVPVALGLREENDRVELSYNQMLVCYETNDWELMESYLKDDLEDTVRVANFIMPAFYYQSLVIPTFNPQQLFIYGNATKLNKFLVEHYGEHRNPETDEPYRFKGGRTEAFCGFYPNTVKVDVASLYPTIMLAYMITSYKDKDNILLGALNYLRDTRLHHKKRAKDKTISSDERLKSDRLQSAFKVVINSIYGFLGAKGIEYNDYEAAALVTAYGRAILKFMMEYTLGQGATIVNMDTDAVAYSSPPGKDREIYEGLVEALPDWIEIEWEWAADVFIPSTICLDNFNKNYKFDSYHGKNIVQKWFPEATNEDLALILTKFGQEKVTFKRFLDISKMLDMDFLTSEGLRKNYIVFVNGGDKVKLFGKYKKRDRSVLQKQFQVEYLRLFRTDKDAAEKYYYKVSDKIEKGLYPIKDLAITKKIRKGAKREIEYGLGQEGDIITSYQSVNGYSLIDSGDAYDIPAYMEELQSLYNEIHDALMIQELTDVR